MDKDKALDLALEALEHMLEDAKQERLTVEYWNECVDAITAIKQARSAPVQEPVKLRRGDVLRCIETDELCTVWATSTTGKTLVKWSANNFGDYTAEQIGELFWIEPSPVQEPVAWRWKREGGEWQLVHQQPRSPTAQPLYTTPPAAPVQEPEQWEHLKAYGYAPGNYMMTCCGCNTEVIGVDKRASRCKPCAIKAAAQRKPLTDEQIDAIWDAVITPSNHIREFVRAIEATLREQNTP